MNGKGNVLVQKCEFKQNFEPSIFPLDSNELCRFERECYLQLSVAPTSWKIPVPHFLHSFLQDTRLDYESIRKFKAPFVLDNRVLEASKAMFEVESNFCCTCCKDLQMNGDPIECPNCHIARYCNQECFDKAKAVHYPVCKSILEANKECVKLGLLKLNDAPQLAEKDDVN